MMPRIDPLLTAMLSNRADAVRLSDGDIAHLVKAGAQHPLTRQPLGDGQLLVLLKEMAPADVGAALGGVDPVEFVYANGEGRFITRVMRQNGSLKATVSPEPSHGNGSHKEAAAQSPVATAVPARPAQPASVVPAAFQAAPVAAAVPAPPAASATVHLQRRQLPAPLPTMRPRARSTGCSSILSRQKARICI
jgi:hypothetical protein